MSDRILHLRPVRLRPSAVLAALLLPAVLFAQVRDQVTDTKSLRRRADSLIVLHYAADSAARSWLHADSVRTAIEDSSLKHRREIRVGGLRIVADTALVPLAERAAGIAWVSLQATFGSAANEIGRERWVLRILQDTTRMQCRSSIFGDDCKTRPALIQSGFAGEGEAVAFTTIQDARNSDPREIATQWRRRGDLVMLNLREKSGAGWVRRLIGTGEDREDLLESVFRDLSLVDRAPGLPCLGGDLAACRRGLGLADEQDSRKLFDEAIRASLLNVALEAGGAEAYPRFAADSALTPQERLEAASRLPLDSLLSRWRGRVLSARPVPANTPARMALAALAWGAILCGISLRSSRWR